MKALLLRSLVAALLIGPAIGFVNEVVSIHNATQYEPPLSTAEIDRMRNLPLNGVQAVLRSREIKLTRWKWLVDSIHYSYFWKHVAEISILPSSGVFLACIWVGWVERRHVHQMRS